MKNKAKRHGQLRLLICDRCKHGCGEHGLLFVVIFTLCALVVFELAGPVVRKLAARVVHADGIRLVHADDSLLPKLTDIAPVAF